VGRDGPASAEAIRVAMRKKQVIIVKVVNGSGCFLVVETDFIWQVSVHYDPHYGVLPNHQSIHIEPTPIHTNTLA
jgi:hypothetical protein